MLVIPVTRYFIYLTVLVVDMIEIKPSILYNSY
jgi:hypothetical protein